MAEKVGFALHPENICTIGHKDKHNGFDKRPEDVGGGKNFKRRAAAKKAKAKKGDLLLDEILWWGSYKYNELPLPVPESIQKLNDDGFINLKNSNLTVLQVYALAVLTDKFQKGDIGLMEQIEGKASVRTQKSEEDLSRVLPDQAKVKAMMEKYKRIN